MLGPLIAVVALLFTAAAVVSLWDRPLIELVRRHDPMDRADVTEFFRVFKGFGKTDSIILMALFLGVFGLRHHAVRILLALAVVTALVLPAKAIVGRERPSGRDNFSFPSGDVATAAAAGVVIGGAAPALIPAAAGVTLLVAAGRVFDLQHHPSDVIAGLAFGVIAAVAAGALRRRFRLRPGRRFFLIVLGVFTVIYVPLHLYDVLVADFVYFCSVWGPALLFLGASFLWRRAAIRRAGEPGKLGHAR